MRQKTYQIVHIYEGNSISVIYKYIMIAFIVLSLDFALRWLTADYKFKRH